MLEAHGSSSTLEEAAAMSYGSIALAYYGVRHSRRAPNKKVTKATRIDPLAFDTTCLETSKHVQVTQQAVSLIEKRVFKKLRHCLSQCERDGLFDREDPEAGKIFLRAFSAALRSVNASKNAIPIKPI